MSLYLLLLGRKESPHHYIPSAQASLTQPDLQLVGHSNTHSAPPKCFSWCLRANSCCQTLPGTLFPGFLFCHLVPLGTLGRSSWAPLPDPRPNPCFISLGSTMIQVTFMPAPDFITRSPNPCPFHNILTIIAMRCWPLAPLGSAAVGRPPLPPPAGAKILWEKVLFPLYSGSEGDFYMRFHFYPTLLQTSRPWRVTFIALPFLLHQHKHQLALLGFIINSRTHPHICYSQLNSTFYEIANAKIIEHHITLSPCMAESP